MSRTNSSQNVRRMMCTIASLILFGIPYAALAQSPYGEGAPWQGGLTLRQGAPQGYPDSNPNIPSPNRYGGPTLADYSWNYTEQRQPDPIKKRDIVFIIVSETAQSSSEADVQRRKNAIYDAVLEEFVRLKDLFTLKPAPQSDGDPSVRGQLTQTYRAENELESREAIQLKISAMVADVRPNGLLVLEAHRSIQVNNEKFLVSLSGVCDPRDIDTDRTIRSERIVNLMLERRNTGHTRDAVKRGWLTRIIDTLDPF